jgi:chromosomal replication initiation ATPase DnaA
MKNLEKELLNLETNLKPLRTYYKNKPQIEQEKKDLAINICEVVCAYYGVKYGQLMSKYRGELVTQARQMAMYIIREKTQLGPEAIAKIFDRDRTTYLYSFNKIGELVRSKYRDDIKQDYFNINIQL